MKKTRQEEKKKDRARKIALPLKTRVHNQNEVE